MTPLVSIVTPCYNAESYISLTINSVLAQTFGAWEMLVIDDCSTDRSSVIVKEFAAKDCRIKYLKTDQPSHSPTRPRNMGINAARGRYIAFLDSDDMWLPEKLEEQLKIVNQNEVAIVFSNYEKIDKEGQRSDRKVIAPSYVDYSRLLKGNCIGCLTAMYDTAKVGKVFFKNVGHEDCVLWLDILKKGFKAQNTNTIAALYRVGNLSVSSNKLKILSWQWNILRNEEHFPIYKAFYFYVHYAIRGFLKSMK